MTDTCAFDSEKARAEFDAHIASCADYLAQRNPFQARQSLHRALAIPGIDQSEARAMATKLGAAEAALWLRRFAENVSPTEAELSTTGSTVGFALSAWLSPELHNDERWALFDEAGGDRSLLSNSSMRSIAKLARSLEPGPATL